MKGWRAAGRVLVVNYLAEDFSRVVGVRRIRRFAVHRGRRVTLH